MAWWERAKLKFIEDFLEFQRSAYVAKKLGEWGLLNPPHPVPGGGSKPSIFPWGVVVIDGYIKDNLLVIQANVPGVDPRDINISVVPGALTVAGERKPEAKVESADYLFEETGFGEFRRTIPLLEGVDISKIRATFNNGVLKITMPVKAEFLPQKVNVELEEVKKAA